MRIRCECKAITFTRGVIIGVDNNPDACSIIEDRIVALLGGQADPETANMLNFSTMPDWIDIIIDDGSHKANDQIGSVFNCCFRW